MNKFYNHKVFDLDTFQIICESQDTRYGFRHLATLMIKGREAEYAKACYYNRTWEKFCYQSVIQELLEKTRALTPDERKLAVEYIKNYSEQTPAIFKSIKIITAIGEVLGKDQKERNDFMARIMKAGLEKRGLIMPDNWDTLSENEKERRLNGATSCLT